MSVTSSSDPASLPRQRKRWFDATFRNLTSLGGHHLIRPKYKMEVAGPADCITY